MFFPALLAFLIASLIALLELVTSEYPRTSSLLLKGSWALYVYAAIYGIISFAVVLALDYLSNAEIVKLEGLGLTSPWFQAITVGLTIKAFFHIRLFNVTHGSQSFPVGVETIVQLFEPWLLQTIKLDEFNLGRNYIDPRAQEYNDLDDVKSKIKENLPRTLSDNEKVAFQLDVDKTTTPVEAMELYFTNFGKKSFDRVFPPIEK